MRYLAIVAACIVVTLSHPAVSQELSDYYRGKNVDFLISTGVGATYDAYARALARHMKRHMPGEPTFVPKQMEGAGGIIAANYIYNIAPKNGLVLASVNNPIPYMPLLGNAAAKYDSSKIEWIGSAAAETAVLIATRESGVTTIDDAISKGMSVATNGAGSGSYFNAHLINRFVGTKLKIVAGYKASVQSLLAMEQGEVDGFPGIMLSTLAFSKPDWVPTGRVNILLQLSDKRHPSLANIPTILERITSPADESAVRLALAPLLAARPIMAPPGTPEIYVKALRNASKAALSDPEFLADLQRERLDTFGWMDGEQLRAFIEQVYRTEPKDVSAIAEMMSR